MKYLKLLTRIVRKSFYQEPKPVGKVKFANMVFRIDEDYVIIEQLTDKSKYIFLGLVFITLALVLYFVINGSNKNDTTQDILIDSVSVDTATVVPDNFISADTVNYGDAIADTLPPLD
jgi:6-phosphogluconolactonase/glucosamine-6-phosphate isomerase/deaminase